MSLNHLFISPTDGRLRAGWRILFFFALYFSVVFLLAILAILALGFAPPATDSRSLLLTGLLSGSAVGVATYAARRTVDRKSVESLGVQPARMWPDLLAGFGIAGLMMLLVFLWMSAAGWLAFEGYIWQKAPFARWALDSANMILLFLLVGVTEELQFRGYIQQNIEEGWSTVGAVVITSILFALLHIANPNAFALAPMVGITLAGLFFSFAYLRTRTLWLAIGLHIGWNFFENTVFGFAVSGINFPGWLQHDITGPELWTGGSFGPEAGLVLLPALLLGTGLVWLYTRSR